MIGDDRYEGRPFLRLLDFYILRVIGQLGEEQASALRSIEPKLAEVYGEQNAWYELVAKQMEFPDEMDANILDIWAQAQLQATGKGVTIDPAQFTRQFVDANFL